MVRSTKGQKKQLYLRVYDLDMNVEVHLLKKTPAVLALGKLCEETSNSYEWRIQISHHTSLRMRSIECKTDNHILLVVLSVQATHHQTHAG